MCDRSTDTYFCSFFLLEVIGSYPIRMVFPLKIKLSLMAKLFLINRINSIFLNVDIAIMVVLPECDLVRIGTDQSPFLRIEVLLIMLLVSHWFSLKGLILVIYNESYNLKHRRIRVDFILISKYNQINRDTPRRRLSCLRFS